MSGNIPINELSRLALSFQNAIRNQKEKRQREREEKEKEKRAEEKHKGKSASGGKEK